MPVKEHGGILGELIPRMVWKAVASPCVESTDFVEFYDFLVNLFEGKNGFEIRCAPRLVAAKGLHFIDH